MAKVHCDWTESGFLVIPDEAFDPSTHRRYGEPAPSTSGAPADATDTPADAERAGDERQARRRGR